MAKFEFELLEDSDEGAEADDEETDEDCEIEDIRLDLVGHTFFSSTHQSGFIASHP